MNGEKREAMELLLANRFYLYSLMHKCFGREPDRQQLELLTGEQTGKCFALLGGEVLEKVPAFLEQLREDLKDPDFPEQVKREYRMLFIGPEELPAPPWESVYMSGEAALFQAATLEVRQAYRAFGMQAEAYQRVPDDSLALELAFMSALAERALNAFRGDNRAEAERCLTGSADFLKKHLLVWIPKFLERMAASPTDCLYPQLCLILDSFLKKDAETAEELLKELQNGG